MWRHVNGLSFGKRKRSVWHVQVVCFCCLLTWRACLWAAGSGSQIRPAWWPTWRRRWRLNFRGDTSPKKPPPPPHSALSDTRPCMHRHRGKVPHFEHTTLDTGPNSRDFTCKHYRTCCTWLLGRGRAWPGPSAASQRLSEKALW